MTAAERLRSLAGVSGTAAALLLAIGAGATAGAALVNYSGLPSATAAEHLLAASAEQPQQHDGTGGTILIGSTSGPIRSSARPIKSAPDSTEGDSSNVGNTAPGTSGPTHAELVAQALGARSSELRGSRDVLAPVFAGDSGHSGNTAGLDEASLRQAESLRAIDAERVALNAARDDEELAMLMILIEAA